MNERTPAVDIVAALDAPLGWVRQNLGALAPTFAVCVLMVNLPNLPTQFISARMQQAQSENPLAALAWLPLLYVGPCLSLVGFFVASAVEALCVANILDGRGGGLFTALSRGASLRLWLGAVLVSFLLGIGLLMCCFGGFLMVVPFGMGMAALVDEDLGVGAIARSVQLSTMRTGPGFFDRPGWKVLAVSVASYAVLFTVGQVAAVPTWVAMGGQLIEAFKSGDPQAIQHAMQVNPWIGAVTILLSSFMRVFTDAYVTAAVFLIYRDARRRFGGADLEAAIEGPVG